MQTVKWERVIILALVVLGGWYFLNGGRFPIPVGPVNPPVVVVPVVTAPFKTDKLAVLVIEETLKRGSLSEGQQDVILATGEASVRSYVEKAGGVFRLQDLDNTAGIDAQWVKDALLEAKSVRQVDSTKVPWIVAANPKTGFSKPLGTAVELLVDLKKMEGK